MIRTLPRPTALHHALRRTGTWLMVTAVLGCGGGTSSVTPPPPPPPPFDPSAPGQVTHTLQLVQADGVAPPFTPETDSLGSVQVLRARMLFYSDSTFALQVDYRDSVRGAGVTQQSIEMGGGYTGTDAALQLVADGGTVPAVLAGGILTVTAPGSVLTFKE